MKRKFPSIGLTTKNWVSPDTWEYIQRIRDLVHDLEQRTQKAKENVELIEKLMNAWSKQPLYERKEGIASAPLFQFTIILPLLASGRGFFHLA